MCHPLEMPLKPLLIVGGLVALTVVSGCVGQYKSDFSVAVVNQAVNSIQVLANGNEIGQVPAGQTGSFTIRVAETNANQFANGVAPTPQAQVILSAKDLKTGVLSTTKSLMLSQGVPTYVTFSQTDFSVSETVARFTYAPTTPGINEEVTLNASSSTASGATFTWDFGDGGTGAGATVAHQYARTGSFTITLTVTSDTGQSSTASRLIAVSFGSPQIRASFTFSPATPETDQDVFFNAWASTPNDGTLTWSFGDGSSGAGATPAHRYTQRGTYIVRLTVTNAVGQSAATSNVLNVRPRDPYGAVIETCRSQREVSLVACVNSFVHGRDERTDFEVVKRVAWILHLEGEDGGLLVKPGGDNIWTWQGYSFSTSRVCTPLSWIWKIFSDAGLGGANAPIWTDNGPTSETGSYCVPAMDPTLP